MKSQKSIFLRFEYLILLLSYTTLHQQVAADPSTSDQYSIQDENNNFCFLMKFQVGLDVSYVKKDQSSESVKFSNFSMEQNLELSKCEANVTTLVLFLHPKPTTEVKWVLDLQFTKVGDPQNFQVSSTKLTFTPTEDLFPGISKGGQVIASSTSPWAKAPVGSYYHCIAPQTQELSAPDTAIHKVGMRVTDISVEAFMSSKEEKFDGHESLCDADKTPNNTVPIAVGAALAACIVISLIVFVVFNRRNRRNYGSV